MTFINTNPSLEEFQLRFYNINLRERRSEIYSTTLLHLLCWSYKGKDATRIITWLISPPYSIPIDMPCPRDNGTPLMLAIFARNLNMIYALINCGSNINAHIQTSSIQFRFGDRYVEKLTWTPLDYALHQPDSRQKRIVIYLLDKGARSCVQHKLPKYAKYFLTKSQHLKQVCTLLLGLKFKKLSLFDKNLLKVVVKYVWYHRFDEE